jgi:hypothetical protein
MLVTRWEPTPEPDRIVEYDEEEYPFTDPYDYDPLDALISRWESEPPSEAFDDQLIDANTMRFLDPEEIPDHLRNWL